VVSKSLKTKKDRQYVVIMVVTIYREGKVQMLRAVPTLLTVMLWQRLRMELAKSG
jgi:hypothetical protein